MRFLVAVVPLVALACSQNSSLELAEVKPEPAPLATATATATATAPSNPTTDIASNGRRGSSAAELPQILAIDQAGKLILYLRDGDLFLANRDRSDETRLVRGDGKGSLDGSGDLPLRDFYNIEFHPDGRRALFSVVNGRGEAIGTVDLKTKKIDWLADAFGHQHVVIPRGPNKGHLLLYKHRYHFGPTGGSYDVCILANGWTGKEIRDMSSVDPGCMDSPEMKRALAF